MRRGYTKRWRKRWDKGYHKDLLLWVLMDYFIDFAVYKSTEVFHKGVGLIPLERGQWYYTTRSIADYLAVDPQQIRTRVEMLEKLEFLTRTPTHKYTLISIINYDVYQNIDSQDNTLIDTELTRTQHTPNTPLNTKKVKKVKEGKESGSANRRRQLPQDFILSESLTAYALSNGIQEYKVEDVFNHFCDHHRSKGSVMLDWEAAWRTWVRNEIKFNHSKPMTPNDGLSNLDRLQKTNPELFVDPEPPPPPPPAPQPPTPAATTKKHRLTPSMIAYAQSRKMLPVSIAASFAKMVSWYAAHGMELTDLDRSWRSWISKESAGSTPDPKTNPDSKDFDPDAVLKRLELLRHQAKQLETPTPNNKENN